MSDPVKSVEIEDVLSSIRRLLADGGPQGAPAKTGPRPVDRSLHAPVSPTQGRDERRSSAPLMLTPALRVAGRPEPQEATAPTAPTPFPGNVGRVPKADRDQTDEDFEAPSFPTARKPQDSALRSRLEATIAELEAAITHQVDEWEPDGSEPAPVMDWAQARPEDAPFLSRRHPNSQASVRSGGHPAEGVGSIAPVPEAGFHDGLADEETDEVEAPVAERSEPAPEAMHPADMAEVTELRTLHEAPAEEIPAAAEAPGPVPAGAPQIDEGMLRELIVEVLRDELRGPLGDRITSNLRKLVRREIFRALASGEVD